MAQNDDSPSESFHPFSSFIPGKITGKQAESVMVRPSLFLPPLELFSPSQDWQREPLYWGAVLFALCGYLEGPATTACLSSNECLL